MTPRPLKLELAGLVYRVSDRAGGVLTSEDADRVEQFFADLGMQIENHEFQRIDGCHIVEVRVEG